MSKITTIKSYLQSLFDNPKCELNFDSDFQLLVAVILSAQCTDKRVNQVTQNLFRVAPDAKSMDALPMQEIEQLIFSCGFYHNKAKAIKKMSHALLKDFDGQVPKDFDTLLSLDGVGRKTANVVVAVGFGQPAFAVDTHVFRVSHRLGLSNAKTPEKCEIDLKQTFAKKDWANVHHLLVLFGRYYCKAKSPLCKECKLKKLCLLQSKQLLTKRSNYVFGQSKNYNKIRRRRQWLGVILSQ